MGKTCYKNMGVSAHGHSAYATSVTFNETATLQQIKTLGSSSDVTILTNQPKGTCEYSTIMTDAADITSLTGRVGKAGGSSISAGALSVPGDNRMTSMSVEAQAGGVITIKSSNAFNGQTSFGGTPSTPTAMTITPLLAQNIVFSVDDGAGGAYQDYSGTQSMNFSIAQSFTESEVIGSNESKQALSDGTITLSIDSNAADIDYDIVQITGSGGICPTGGADTRAKFRYKVELKDCSGEEIYTIQHSGALEGRSTSAAPGSTTKTTLTFVDKFPNDLFPDLTEDCA